VGVTPWEGVRNAEARNIMKEMKIGDQVCGARDSDAVHSLGLLTQDGRKVLFYHSNCKNPGTYSFNGTYGVS
jgi:predicted RNA-binding protein with PUA-like domain